MKTEPSPNSSNEAENPVKCRCINDCVRHGDCDACKAHHVTIKTKAYCMRRKKTK